MFELKVVKRFDAAHGLRNFKGADEPVHWHDWRLEVFLSSEKLDASGCAIDFHEVDRAIDEAIAPYQGKSFNDVGPFTHESPSAEAIARHLFGVLSRPLNRSHVHVCAVTVCEDVDHCATYQE